MRGKKPKNKIAGPDKKYGSPRLQKFINKVMLHGKKSSAASLVYEALEQAAKKTGADPIEVFNKAIDNVAPAVEVRSRRVGGATYQVPMPVRIERKEMLAMRWMIESARNRSGKQTADLLSDELIAAYNGEGEAIKMRDNVHKMAEANRAFAHFRW